MSKAQQSTGRLDPPRLVTLGGDGRVAVTVSHLELGNLIGELLRMFELNGDIEQREAQKRTTKEITRRWLDQIYKEAGYSNYENLEPVHSVINGDPLFTEEQRVAPVKIK